MFANGLRRKVWEQFIDAYLLTSNYMQAVRKGPTAYSNLGPSYPKKILNNKLNGKNFLLVKE